MNDPGTDEPIRQAAQELEPQLDGHKGAEAEEKKLELEQEQDYMDPSRWWFASTGAPLLAGTFGPLANGFSVCALVENWRLYLPDGQVEIYGTRIADPKWLVAINAISLVCAIIGNLTLLLNMANRLRFKIAQPLTITGFFMAGLLLIIDMAVLTSSPTYRLPADSPAAPAAAHALSQAFYYAIFAAGIYIIVSALMCATVYGVYKGHFEAEFRLTAAQRTLMLQTMAFVVYHLLGALIFSRIEGWYFLDGVYWADITLLTIGLGSDFHPSTHAGRSLLFFYAIGGIIIIGLVIGSIRTLVLDRGKKKLSARLIEKKRLTAVNTANPKTGRIRIGRFKTMKYKTTDLTPAQRREQEFHIMRSIQDSTQHDRKWMALAVSVSAAMTLWLIGALVFTKTEYAQHWNYFDSLYFCYVCLLTIGYGDLYPQSNSGRAFFVLWTIMAIPTLTILISDMGDTVVQTFSNITIWIGSITVLPGESGTRSGVKNAIKSLSAGKLNPKDFKTENAPGFLRDSENGPQREGADQDQAEEDQESDPCRPRNEETPQDPMMDHIAKRMARHLEQEELDEAEEAERHGDTTERDIHFYHYVLSREIRNMVIDLNVSPPKRYNWDEWEYFLKLMDEPTGSDAYSNDTSGQEELVPDKLKTPDRSNPRGTWSWLSDQTPLMGHKSETEWILERLGTTLERELKESRRPAGSKQPRKPPPVSLADMLRRGRKMQSEDKTPLNSAAGSDADSPA